jgi:hypothetical protein
MVATDINVNSSNGSANTVDIGSAQSTATHLGTAIKINSTNSSANTVEIGSVQTTSTHLGSTIAINSTNGSSNTVNIGSNTTTATILGSLIGIGNSSSTNVNIESANGLGITGGIRMANTNKSGLEWKINFGVVTSTPACGGGGGVVGSNFVGYGGTANNFSSPPQVFLSVQKVTFAPSGAFLNVSLDAVPLSTNFYWAMRNTSGSTAAANSYQVSWIAIGPA